MVRRYGSTDVWGIQPPQTRSRRACGLRGLERALDAPLRADLGAMRVHVAIEEIGPCGATWAILTPVQLPLYILYSNFFLFLLYGKVSELLQVGIYF